MDASQPFGLREPAGDPWCLDFVNTVGYRLGPKRNDRLSSPDTLFRWLRESGIATAEAQNDLNERIFERALELREAIYGLTLAHADQRNPNTSDLMVFNLALRDALVHLRVDTSGRTAEWNHETLRQRASTCIGLIALSAAALLTGIHAPLIRACANDECGWLFVDMSKNRSRKWCSMSDCGNLAKARRHYQKKKTAA